MKFPTKPEKQKPHDNFALLRLIMAILVMISHYKVISGGQLLTWLPMAGDWRVASFFVVSGYVIYASYEKQPYPILFYTKRFFRIYPLYFMMIIMQAVGMSLFFLDDIYAQIHSIIRYIATNLVMLNFLQYDIGNLLKDAPNKGINASLWTLKVEMIFYVAMPLLFWWCNKFKIWGMLALFLISTVYAEYMVRTGQEQLSRQFPAQIRFIIIGMIFYLWREKFKVPTQIAILLCLIGIPLMQFRQFSLPTFIMPLLAAPLVIMFSTKIPILPQPKIDLSYGIYIMHAPLIQFSLLTGIFRDDYYFLSAFIMVVLLLSFAGYKIVEMPAQGIGKKFTKLLTKKLY